MLPPLSRKSPGAPEKVGARQLCQLWSPRTYNYILLTYNCILTTMENKIADQTRKYITSVGRGSPPESIIDLAHFACDAKPTEYFRSRSSVRFWYETVEKPNLLPRAKGDVVDYWVSVGSSPHCYD